MKSSEVKKILIDFDMPDGKGLAHIAEAVILMDAGWNSVPLAHIYWKIAKDNGISDSCVARRIRTVIKNGKENGCYVAMAHPRNADFIYWLYAFLKERGDG